MSSLTENIKRVLDQHLNLIQCITKENPITLESVYEESGLKYNGIIEAYKVKTHNMSNAPQQNIQHLLNKYFDKVSAPYRCIGFDYFGDYGIIYIKF